jgi:RNA polymerase sigma-70 factor, ECF subfamily
VLVRRGYADSASKLQRTHDLRGHGAFNRQGLHATATRPKALQELTLRASVPRPGCFIARATPSAIPRGRVLFKLPFRQRKDSVAPPAEAALEAPSATSGATALGPADRAMHRYAEGEDAAFDEVFNALAPRINAFLRRLGCNATAAEDLAQETFLRMHRARGSFVSGKQVAPWAYAIARNCFVSQVRSSKVSRASVDVEKVELSSSPSGNVEEETMARQSAAIVARALAAMTPARREAFVLLRYEGMSVSNAAQIVGISEGALKVRAFHAYETLRRELARVGDEPAPHSDTNDNPAEAQTTPAVPPQVTGVPQKRRGR